jgi:photosystem II stability/assembly factor-like uncharacterized protein
MRKSFFPQILGSCLIAMGLLIVFSYTRNPKEAYTPTNIPYRSIHENIRPSMEDMLNLQSAVHLHDMSSKSGHVLTELKNIGPRNMGGRILELSMDPQNPDNILIATQGGMWRSRDGGLTTEVVDDKAPFLPLTAMARNPQNPNTVYYTSGYRAGGGFLSQTPGLGVFKSTDNGATFSPLTATQNSDFTDLYDIAVSPVDSNQIFVATEEQWVGGKLWLSTDGGQSFTEIFLELGRIREIILPEDGSILIGTTDKIYRSPTRVNPTFTELGPAEGITSSLVNTRKDIRACRDFPNVLYFASGRNTCDVYRSNDYGQTWTHLAIPSTLANLSTGGNNRMLLEVKPDDPDFVLVGGINAVYSRDGGQNWIFLPKTHVDYHSAVFHGNYFWMGNDGGLWKYRVDSPEFFVNLNENFVNTEFYGGDFFPTGDGFIGGLQDNGTYRYRDMGNGQTVGDTITQGDGGFAYISRQDPNVAYYEDLGRFYRTDSAMADGALAPNGLHKEIGSQLPGLASFNILFNIATPYTIGPNNHDQVFIPENVVVSPSEQGRVIRSTDGGQTFTPLTLQYDRHILAMGISREQSPTLYYGAQPGKLWRVDNADVASVGSEIDISPEPGTVLSMVQCITPHPTDSNVIYVLFYSPAGWEGLDHVWRVSNVKSANPVWTPIQGDLPQTVPVRWIEPSPVDPDNHLFLSTNVGLYTSLDGGLTWQRDPDLPNVAVAQTRIRETDNKIFIFTHGRGVWNADIPTWATSVERLEEVLSFKLYPNPTTEAISLEGVDKPCYYRIIDMTGKHVLTGRYVPGGSIRISELAKGSYSLILEGKDRRGARVFVKE